MTTGRPRRARTALAIVLATVLSAFAFGPATPSLAAGSFTGGASLSHDPPQYMASDHTPIAVQVSGSGLATSTPYYMKIRFTPDPGGPAGSLNKGFTWNWTTETWVQERSSWTEFPVVTTDENGAFGLWAYTKLGDDRARGQYWMLVSLSRYGDGSTFNGDYMHPVTVLDMKAEGGWIHNASPTAALAGKRASAAENTSTANETSGLLSILALNKVEPNLLDDDANGVIDDEDYGATGNAGDFLFAVPMDQEIDVFLNRKLWNPSNGYLTKGPDRDMAVGATDLSSPTTPTALSALPVAEGVQLDWDDATDDTGVSGYFVYRWQDAGSPYYTAPHSKIATVTGGSAYLDEGASSGQNYGYEVRAFDASGSVGPRSDTAEFDGTPPGTISDLAVSAVTTESVRLTATAPGDDNYTGTADHYELRYSPLPITDMTSFGAATPVTCGAPQASGATEVFDVDGLQPGATYYFGLIAEDEADNQSPLAATTATTDKLGSSVTMTASATSLKTGASLTCSGALEIDEAAAPALKTVQVQSSNSATGPWAVVGEADTAADGRYTLSFVPVSNKYYRAYFPGDAQTEACGCSATRVTVKPIVTKPNTPSATRARRTFTAYGYLKPRHTSGRSSVKLTWYRWNGSRWILKRTEYARNFNYSTYTKYSKRTSLSAKGRWKVRASHTDTGHVLVKSSYRGITVR